MLAYRLSSSAIIPERKSTSAAGYDLYADESIIIPNGTRALVATNIAMAIPEGYYGDIRPRSSLAVGGIDIGAGVIDSDYRGNIKVLLINNSKSAFTVNPGDRVAQLIVKQIFTDPIIESIEPLSTTDRGTGGFGSTGTR